MRILRFLLVAPFVTVASCATVTPVVEEPCRADGGCDHADVQTRVIKAFDALEILSVIECVNEPSTSCYSVDPDEDACLVIVQPGAAEVYASQQNATPTQPTTSSPTSVSYFSRWLEKPFSRVFSDKRPQSQHERLIYSEPERSLAVLVLAEERCFNVNEVAAPYR
jgi:hypothetical protein